MKYPDFILTARQAVREVLPELKTLLAPYGLDIEENTHYDWDDSPGAVAVYESGSVFGKTIIFALNLPFSFEVLSDVIAELGSDDPGGDIREALSVSIWHEAIHGLWEYIDDLLWSDAQVRRRAYAEQWRVGAVDAFSEDEEEVVEDCARWLAEHGLNAGDPPDTIRLLLDFHKIL